MTTVSQLRKAALAQPEVEEGTHFGMVAFAVHGKGFASVTKDRVVQLQLSETDVDAALAAHSTGERLTRGDTVIGFRVPLVDVNGKDLNALVHRSWLHRAPKRLAAAARAADSGTAATSGDLPTVIGRPATRALLGAGISTLAQVATRTERELLDLHGVGPKAVRILAERLAEQGKSLRS